MDNNIPIHVDVEGNPADLFVNLARAFRGAYELTRNVEALEVSTVLICLASCMEESPDALAMLGRACAWVSMQRMMVQGMTPEEIAIAIAAAKQELDPEHN